MTQATRPVRHAVVFYPSESEGVIAARRMCFEDYLELDIDGKPSEWVDGEARIYMNVTSHHQQIVVLLTRLLGDYCEVIRVGTILTEPYAMRAHPDANAREPDLMFIAEAHRDRIGEQYLDGPCDLAIEVISPDSPARDREEKFAEYAADGVREYWIIDPRPNHREADFYRLEAGEYVPLPVEEGIVRSVTVPGFWLRVEWLWDDRAPALAALREVLGRDPLA